MKKSFRIIEHTADIGIEVRGRTLARLFENAARGMFSLLADPGKVRPDRKLRVSAEGNDRENLLVNWLNELLYLQSVKKMIFSGFEIKSMSRERGYRLSAEIRGRKLAPEDKPLEFELKAATYHGLKIRSSARGYAARIIFDI